MLDKTTILTDEQVKIVVKAMKEGLGQNVTGKIELMGIGFEDPIRMISLQEKCLRAREELGLTIKDIAKKLQAPQYKIKAVEKGMPKEISTKVLEKYIRFLGLDDWFQQWSEANPKLAKKLGVAGSGENPVS